MEDWTFQRIYLRANSLKYKNTPPVLLVEVY